MLAKAAFIRGIIPFGIMTVISIIMHYQKIDSFQVRSTFLVGLIITSVAASSVIYEVENWSLFKQSGIHFLIMLLTVLPVLLISGWFPLNTVLDYLKVVGLFLITGVVMWIVSYVVFGKLLS